MKKVLSIIVVIVMITLALFTVGCTKKTETETPAIIVTTPIVSQDVDNELLFSWRYVDGVSNYVMELDGTESNIGLPIFDEPLNFANGNQTVVKVANYCITSELTAGKHEVRFAAAIDGTKSAFSQKFEFVVESVNEDVPAAPAVAVVGDTLRVTGVTGNVKIFVGTTEINVVTENGFYIKDLTTIEGLEEGKYYDITAKNVNEYGDSLSSNLVKYFLATDEVIPKPTYEMFNGEYILNFGKSYRNFIINFFVGDNEYVVRVNDGKSYTYYSFVELVEDEDFLADILDGKSITYNIISNDGKTTSEKSEAFTYTLDDKMIEEIVYDCYVFNYDNADNTGVLQYNLDPAIFNRMATVKLYKNDVEVTPLAVSANRFLFDCSDIVNQVTVKLVVNFVDDDIEDYERIYAEINHDVLAQPLGLKISADGNGVTWDRVANALSYEVTVNDKVEVVEVDPENLLSSYFLDLSENDATDFEISVVAICGKVKSASSSTLKISRVSGGEVSYSGRYLELTNDSSFPGTVKFAVKEKGSNFSNSVLSGDFYNYDLLGASGEVVVSFYALGNGIDLLNGFAKEYTLTLDDVLTYEIIDGNKISIAGSDADLYLDGDKITDKTAVDLLEIERVDGTTYFIISGADSTITADAKIIQPVQVSLSAHRISNSPYIAPSAVYERTEYIYATDTLGSFGLKYEYLIYKRAADGTEGALAKSGSTTGETFSYNYKDNLSVGEYNFYLRIVGNGGMFSSAYKRTTIHVLDSVVLNKYIVTNTDDDPISIVANLNDYIIYWEAKDNTSYSAKVWELGDSSNAASLGIYTFVDSENEKTYRYINLNSYTRYDDADSLTVQVTASSSYAAYSFTKSDSTNVTRVAINYYYAADKTYYVTYGDSIDKYLVREKSGNTLGAIIEDTVGTSFTHKSLINLTASDTSYVKVALNETATVKDKVSGSEHTGIKNIVLKKYSTLLSQVTFTADLDDYTVEYWYLDDTSTKVDIDETTIVDTIYGSVYYEVYVNVVLVEPITIGGEQVSTFKVIADNTLLAQLAAAGDTRTATATYTYVDADSVEQTITATTLASEVIGPITVVEP